MAEEPITVDADYYETDSAYSPDDHEWQTGDTTSIGSSIYQGLMLHGRRYQSLRQKEYIVPSDELQFETYQAGHIVDLILNYHKENALFQSPIGENRDASLQILDIGTGRGSWAIDVADMLPNSYVRGVDLYPPPIDWTPPNCIFEVDDILEEWTWRESFDLIHMANMIGSFDSSEWERVYQQCYDKLQPGAWFEQFEIGPFVESDDGTLPPDSALASWGPMLKACGERAGRSCSIISTMSSNIRRTGFVDVHERVYKWPIGPWPKDERIKEAGVMNFQHWMTGMEGWCMWLLTKYGTPQPWTTEEVYVFCAKIRNELRQGRYHCYHKARRVWARKPFPGEIIGKPANSRSPTAMSTDFMNLRAQSGMSRSRSRTAGSSQWHGNKSISRSPMARYHENLRPSSKKPNSSPPRSHPNESPAPRGQGASRNSEPLINQQPSRHLAPPESPGGVRRSEPLRSQELQQPQRAPRLSEPLHHQRLPRDEQFQRPHAPLQHQESPHTQGSLQDPKSPPTGP